MNSYDDDERERPSWRDLDRKKDRSKHVSGDRPAFRPKSAKAQWAQKQYLKEVENLFKGKKASKDHAIAHEEIHKYAGTNKFNTTVKKYLAEYDLPDDWSTLFLLLDYKDHKVVKRVIAVLQEKAQEDGTTSSLQRALDKVLAERGQAGYESFKSKLRIIAMTTSDGELKEIAEETVEGL